MFSSLRNRIISLLFLGFSLAVLSIGVLFFQYRTQIEHTVQLGQANEISTSLDNIFAHVLHASNTSRRFVIGNDPSQLDEYELAVASIPADMEKLRELSQGQAEFLDELAILETRLAYKLAHLDEILKLHSAANVMELQRHLVGGDGLERLENFRGSIAQFRGLGYDQAKAKMEQIRISVLIQFVIVTLMIFCGIIWATILGNEAIRNVLIPISAMNAQIRRIAAGDYQEMLPVPHRDEVGRLAEQINLMTSQLSNAETEREKAQKDLATERQNLIDAVEALGEGFAAYDAQGRLMQCNSTFLDYYPSLRELAKPGVSYETLLRHKAKTKAEPFAVGQEEEFVKERLDDINQTNTIRECTLADGRVLQRSSYRTSYGGLVAVYVDITKIKEAEDRLREINRELDARVGRRTEELNAAYEQLQQVNAELDAVIQSAPIAIVVLSTDREVVTWNPAAIEMTGLQAHEVKPNLANLVPKGRDGEFQTFLDSVYEKSNTPLAEIRMCHRNGKAIEARISASVLSDENGKLIGSILIIADLTEARALRQQFEQSQKLEVVAKLTAGLAHDFNNLLAIVIANIEMLEKRLSGDTQVAGMLGSAKTASLSGVELNKKLLAFSREGSSDLERIELIEEMDFLKPLLQITLGEAIALDFSIQDDLWPLFSDRSLLQSAVLNLAVNARDAMSGEGRLSVTAQNIVLEASNPKSALSGQFVELSFTDTGIGMKDDIKQRVLEPFFTTKDFGKGSGLGLSMVYGFVKQCGGDIHIESQDGKGTTVSLLFPRNKVAKFVENDAKVLPHMAKGNNQTILVVEDNDEMRRILMLQLAELGFHPIQAESGATALDLLEAGVSIDLLLSDIVMPGGINGYDLAKKALKLRPELPVLFLSGYPANSDGSDEASMESLGIKVLAKPIPQQELGLRILEAVQTDIK